MAQHLMKFREGIAFAGGEYLELILYPGKSFFNQFVNLLYVHDDISPIVIIYCLFYPADQFPALQLPRPA
jgi:hypothetical protein